MSRDEDPVDCAVRELREETGVVVTGADLTLAGCHTQRRARHIDHVYLLDRVPTGDIDASDRFEIAEIGWWPVDALPALRHEAAAVVDRYL